MKKHLYLILFVFIFSLTACNQPSIEKNGVEKGLGDILRIEISKFQYTIFNQDGNKELYNIWISEKSCIIEDLQAEKRKQMPYYTIENNPKLIEIYNLIK